MITIQKRDHKIVCTKQTFINQYESQGYQIVSEKKGAIDKIAPLSIKKEVISDENNKKEEKELEKSTITKKDETDNFEKDNENYILNNFIGNTKNRKENK